MYINCQKVAGGWRNYAAMSKVPCPLNFSPRLQILCKTDRQKCRCVSTEDLTVPPRNALRSEILTHKITDWFEVRDRSEPKVLVNTLYTTRVWSVIGPTNNNSTESSQQNVDTHFKQQVEETRTPHRVQYAPNVSLYDGVGHRSLLTESTRATSSLAQADPSPDPTLVSYAYRPLCIFTYDIGTSQWLFGN